MNSKEPETTLAERIRQHLHTQFPATEGHIPLKDMLLQVYTMEEDYQELLQAATTFRDAKGRYHTQLAAEELFKLLPL